MEWRNQDKTWKLIDKLKHMVGKTVACEPNVFAVFGGKILYTG